MARHNFCLGTYKGHGIYDELCSREDLKRIIFENLKGLAGSKPLLVVENHPNSVYHALRWGFLKDGVVIATVALRRYGNYRLQLPPYGAATEPDFGQLKTKRRFLSGCSFCGKPRDIYRCGQFRLCPEHKNEATKLLTLTLVLKDQARGEKERNEAVEEAILRDKDRLHAHRHTSKHQGNRQL